MPVPGNSPLLVGEEESGTPTLGAARSDGIEQSPLERLIAQSTSEQAAARSSAVPFFLDEPESPSPHSRQFRQNHRNNNNNTFFQPMSAFASSLATMTASTLCLVQMGLVWSSYLSDSWFDTYLDVSVSWQKEYLPSWLDGTMDTLLSSSTLSSLLSTFIGSEQHWASTLLLLSALIIPCLAMILCPSWTIGDYNRHFSDESTRSDAGCKIPRIIFEYILRLSFMAYFILAILDMGMSSIEIENNQTKIIVTNRIRGGLVSYTLGMTCALGVIVVLRLARLGSNNYYRPNASQASPSANGNNNSNNTPRAPPNRAFQLPWRNDGDNRQLRRPLLEDTDEETPRGAQTGNNSRTDFFETTNYHGLSFCKKTVVFELGVLSTVLWLPALFLELFEVDYQGLASTFMSELKFSVHYWEVPAVLWQRGATAGTKEWILVALGTTLLSLAFVLPILATVLCIAAWRTKPGASRFCRNILWLIQPCLCSITFAVSLLLAVPAFGPIGDYLLEEETSGICKQFKEITEASCLTMDARPSLGLWFLLAQSVALEAFVLVTILWE